MTSPQLITCSMVKLNIFSLILVTKLPIFTTFTQNSTGSPSQRNQARKRNKNPPTRKEEVELFLFADGTLLYIEKLKEPTKTKTVKINKFTQ